MAGFTESGLSTHLGLSARLDLDACDDRQELDAVDGLDTAIEPLARLHRPTGLCMRLADREVDAIRHLEVAFREPLRFGDHLCVAVRHAQAKLVEEHGLVGGAGADELDPPIGLQEPPLAIVRRHEEAHRLGSPLAGDSDAQGRDLTCHILAFRELVVRLDRLKQVEVLLVARRTVELGDELVAAPGARDADQMRPHQLRFPVDQNPEDGHESDFAPRLIVDLVHLGECFSDEWVAGPQNTRQFSLLYCFVQCGARYNKKRDLSIVGQVSFYYACGASSVGAASGAVSSVGIPSTGWFSSSVGAAGGFIVSSK